jgi:transposase
MDINKENCIACIKDDQGTTIRQCTFVNNNIAIENCIKSIERREETRPVMESTESYWYRLHNELEQSGIDVSLTKLLKTRIIAEEESNLIK